MPLTFAPNSAPGSTIRKSSAACRFSFAHALAWAHDFVSNSSLGAVFESLPGTNFVVNGAPLPQNSALMSAGAELFITPRLTLLAKFDGEFAPGSQTYAGSGTLRYSW